MSLRYTPGPRYLVASPGLALLTADEELARRVWSAVDATNGTQDVLVELVRDGLATLGAFVLVDAREGWFRVLVRGELSARVDAVGGPVEWTGAGISTWAEKAFDGADAVLVGDADASADRLPLRAGIVRSAGFELRRTEPDADGSPSAASAQRSSGGPVIGVPDQQIPAVPDQQISVVPAPPFDDPVPIAAATPPPMVAATPLASAKPATLQVSSVEAEPTPVPPLLPPLVVVPAPTADPAQTRTENLDDGFDHLFESTIMRSVEDAAIRDSPDEAASGTGPAAGNHTADGNWTAEAPVRLGDHDGYTITAAQLGALRQQFPSPEPIDFTPPPGARLELSTGDVVALDRDVVIGRRPEVDRVQGGRVPTVVTVPSPRQDVSRTHLRIGWSGQKVLATDLHSMNGTVLFGVDGTSRTLDGGVPHQLVEGDVLDIGDGVTVSVRLPPAQAAP